MTKDEALKLTLEFANDIQRGKYKGNAETVITAIKAALEAKDEPVALKMDVIVVNLVREGINKHRARELAEHFIKHTTTPPQRKPLTDEEIYLCTNHIDRNARGWANEFARAIEAAHNIKGEA